MLKRLLAKFSLWTTFLSLDLGCGWFTYHSFLASNWYYVGAGVLSGWLLWLVQTNISK